MRRSLLRTIALASLNFPGQQARLMTVEMGQGFASVNLLRPLELVLEDAAFFNATAVAAERGLTWVYFDAA